MVKINCMNFDIISGIHRNLGVHCSRARSLLMDEKIWNPTLVEVSLLCNSLDAK